MDQLKVILKFLGKQDQEDLSFVYGDDIINYLQEIQVDYKKVKFE